MTIEEIVAARSITEILHFTTNKGVLGVLDSRSLKSRARLNSDERLEYIFQPNAINRDKDLAWLDFVNLSVSRINSDFFSASGNWHRSKNIFWCVLSFSPEILTHANVHFSTTNNIYTGVKRGSGAVALERMFESEIVRWNGNTVIRSSEANPSYTTCVQAEVLYPGQVSTKYLTKIYVAEEGYADELAGQISMLRHPPIPIEINRNIFL